ncbi:YbaK/EbsC family protein [Streptomyces boncukensis]|uniref:YbaK/EbsC family protein n=1 Tax=Streptomyces boncukensis TaxID=2711219 RepID=A0A6G4X3F4_9ACTN|nr:YbaK/EbsC family protein [Streptomyces boncukensis]NGO72076.1 YbaK/EbsC family protein [Streptomyces boncukensis]
MDSDDRAPEAVRPAGVLASRGAQFRLREHPGVTRIDEVCAALGVPLGRTVKTLAFVTPGRRLVLAGLRGDARLRYGELARAAGVRRADLSPAGPEVLGALGMEPGGLCPVSADTSAVVVFDDAVSGMGTVYCGSGRADSTVEIDARDLIAAVPAPKTAPIAQPPPDGAS